VGKAVLAPSFPYYVVPQSAAYIGGCRTSSMELTLWVFNPTAGSKEGGLISNHPSGLLAGWVPYHGGLSNQSSYWL